MANGNTSGMDRNGILWLRHSFKQKNKILLTTFQSNNCSS